jgi:hypothetical protein
MSESALIRAVRDQIRTHADFDAKHANVELDEQAPSIAPDRYVMVIPAGVEPGPTLATSGTVIDKLYSIEVSLALRAPKKPRDYERDLFIALTDSWEVYRRSIESKVDFAYAVIDAANTLMIAEGTATGVCDTFIKPLRFNGLGRFRNAPAELFAGFPGETQAAIIRTIRFTGARRLVAR